MGRKLFGMNKTNKLVVLVISLMMFFLGFEASGFQISLLSISNELGISGVQQGVLVASQYVAIILMPPIFGRIADRFGKKGIVCIFGVVFAIGCLIVVLSSSYVPIVLGVFIIGCGYSVSESVSVSLFAHYFPDSANKYVNISQSLFSLGAVISPLLTRWLTVATGTSWRIVFIITGTSFLVLSLMLHLMAPPTRVYAHSQKLHKSHLRTLLPGYLIVFLIGAILIYSGLEIGIGFFLDTFMVFGFEGSSMSALVLSSFWLAMIPARIISGHLYRHKKHILIVCYIVSVPTIALLAFVTNPAFSLVLVIILGLSLGPIWPNLMSYAAENTKDASFATGIMYSGCGIGGVAFPILIGWSSELYGIRNSFKILSVLAFFGLLMVIVYFLQARTKKKSMPV